VQGGKTLFESIAATFKRLEALLEDETDIYTNRLPLNQSDKYAIFSDLHFGDGGGADNFVHNEHTLICALDYYRENDYSVILLGDIEEFWQFDLEEIHGRYKDTVYSAFQKFKPGRIHRVFGNHDLEWKGLNDPVVSSGGAHRWAEEAIKLGDDVFLTHGHQGEPFCDKNTWIGRFAAHAFKYVEPLARRFGYESNDATKSQIPKGRERTFYRFAKDHKIILICGHTHRAMFASLSYTDWLKEQIELKQNEVLQVTKDREKVRKLSKEMAYLRRELDWEMVMGRDIDPLERDEDPLPCYFNCGCGLYRSGITNIEIEQTKIRLIKWHNDETLPPDERRKQYWPDVGDNLRAFIAEVAKGP
jgi:UDP-2,3-diacylglucosamine pyrophosphatase LpxH